MSAQMLLRARREGDPRSEDLADRLARNVLLQTEALDRIASDFRQFAGSPDRSLETVSADDMLVGIEELVTGITADSAVQLSFAPGAGDAELRVDIQEMRRVFLNLIHNAVQACGDAGHVAVRSAPDDGFVRFEVADDGPGVSEEARARLFEPYFTTKSSGTGLGLAICRRIVDAHGGSIELASSEADGAVFEVRLPVA
jgi:signal transduction histidine kinase